MSFDINDSSFNAFSLTTFGVTSGAYKGKFRVWFCEHVCGLI